MGNKNHRHSAPEAKLTPPASNGFSLISDQKLIDLYAGLLKCRMASETAIAPRNHNLTPLQTSLRGREAGTIATTIDLGSSDTLALLHHGLVHTPIPFSPAALLCSFDASANGSRAKASNEKEPSPARPESQSAIHAILGSALAQKTSNQASISVILAHQGEQPAWQEALNIAAVHGLPLIFVSQPRRRFDPAELTTAKVKPGKSNGTTPAFLPRIPVDSNDTVAIYRVASEAIARARKGRGPTVIECRPFAVDIVSSNGRNRIGHHAHNQPSRDPILTMERYLHSKGLFSREVKSGLLAYSARELDLALKAAPRKSK